LSALFLEAFYVITNRFYRHAVKAVTVSMLLMTFVSLANSQTSRRSANPRPKRSPPQTRLSAEDVARRYLPAVVLITCDDANGNTLQATGFLISRGIIVTNYHVVEGMVRGQVKLAPLPGRKQTTVPIISILDSDPAEDLALLWINGKTTESNPSSSSLSPDMAEMLAVSKRARGQDEPTRPNPSSDDPLGIDAFLEDDSIPRIAAPDEPVSVGETIYVLGNPEGLVGSISQGIVSGIRRLGTSQLIQITASISPGSSGGPVINTRGRVIGVVTASLTEGQNLNFAIPSESIRKLVTRFVP
jgi:S1-C subfamily serine protease